MNHENYKRFLANLALLLDYHPNTSEEYYRDPTPFEKLVLDMSENREVIREVIFFATPSLLLGLICGVLATYGIAGIISTRNYNREQSYAESEYPAQSNYRAPGSDVNTAGPNIPGKVKI